MLNSVLPLLALALVQPATARVTERQVLEAEHARGTDTSILAAATRSGDPRLQRQAARALGRFERAELAGLLEPLVRAPDAAVRREAINALGQMNARFAYGALLASERDATVRGVIYETIGRVRTTPDSAEAVLARGFGDASVEARAGAARGLESLVRRTGRTTRPVATTIEALRRAVREPSRAPIATELRVNALRALLAAGDRDSLTIDAGMRDPSDMVRLAAVTLGRRWMNDPSYIVRWQALRSAGNCDRYVAAVRDSNEHVVLLAIDSLASPACRDRAVPLLKSLVSDAASPAAERRGAHALVALARTAPADARPLVAARAKSPAWYVRTYVATAARLAGDSATLSALAHDAVPNVAIVAMTSTSDATRGLGSAHAGLVMEAVDKLTAAGATATAVSPMLDALDRFTRTGRATVRDPRVKLLEALAKLRDSARIAPRLRPLLADVDPSVAAAAQTALRAQGDVSATARTTRYEPAPLPGDAVMRAMRGATAEIRMARLGTIRMELLTDDAPVAVATFVGLAESGAFNGLTFHRIVTNFVLQGGSPGADEYDAIAPTFGRDEVGLTRNARGTFGVSTRGRDTGDGQLYINLIDNFRLDHDYTVFARTIAGMSVVDRIQEGDVIESIRIIRSSGTR